MPIRLPDSFALLPDQDMSAPLVGRLPLVICLATLGVGGIFFGSAPVFAQSSAVPTRMAPLLVDPALLGGTPVVAPPALPAALGGSVPTGRSPKKAVKPSATADSKPVPMGQTTPSAPQAVAAAQPAPVSTPVSTPTPTPEPQPTPADRKSVV